MATHIKTPEDAAIKPGATIFVTGVNGLIGSYVADELLARGYRVRGAVRSVEKSAWLGKYFTEKYGKDVGFELVEVPDMTVKGCYHEVVKGTSAIIHIASPLSGPDPTSTIPIGVSSALNILTAASSTPTITRVVYTSSSIAATYPSPGVRKRLTTTSWNEAALAAASAFASAPSSFSQGDIWKVVYAALKTKSERACWKYMEEEKPGFVFNAVLPNVNFGRVLVPAEQGAPSTVAWGKAAFTGEMLEVLGKVVGPQWWVGTRDTALVHVGALLNGGVTSERLFAFAGPWTFNKLLASYREMFPHRTFPEDIPGLVDDGCEPPTERAEEVLRWIKGEGWDSWESQVREMGEQFDREEL